MRIRSHIAAILSVLAILAPETPAQRPTDYDIKAAFLYNFAKFVDWPANAFESPQSPLIIGVFGPDPFGPTLDRTIRNKTVQDRPLIVRRIQSPERLRECHILFLDASKLDSLQEIIKQIESAPVLTVSEVDGFCFNGGMINFVLEQNRVRFEINPNAATKARLKISSRLLRLARIVADQQRGE